MEKVQKYNVTLERAMHHFWCDECGEYLGVTEEYGDGYYPTIGEFEINFNLNGWYECKKIYVHRARGNLPIKSVTLCLASVSVRGDYYNL